MLFTGTYVAAAKHLVDQPVADEPAPDLANRIGNPTDGAGADVIGDPTDAGMLERPEPTTRPDFSARVAGTSHDARIDFAADAAWAALSDARVDLTGLGLVCQVNDVPPARADVDPALDVLRAANLPAISHPTITLAGRGQKVLDALTLASCYLHAAGDTASSAVVTAGDVWPIVSDTLPSTTPRQRAGAALVLTTEGGRLELISTATASEPELALILHTRARGAIRQGTLAQLDDIVARALHEAEIEPHEIAEVITAYATDSVEHCAIVDHLGLCVDLYAAKASSPSTPPASAVDLIGALVAQAHPAARRPTGTPILVVADSGLGAATATVLRTT